MDIEEDFGVDLAVLDIVLDVLGTLMIVFKKYQQIIFFETRRHHTVELDPIQELERDA